MRSKEDGAPETETVADNLLEGAAAIAEFVKGDPKKRREIYDMDPRILGLFHMGRTLCGLKSVIRQRIAALAEPERTGIAEREAGDADSFRAKKKGAKEKSNDRAKRRLS